jgi:hypothetical protein
MNSKINGSIQLFVKMFLLVIKEALNKSFDRLRMYVKELIPFVVSLSNHEWNQLIQGFLNVAGWQIIRS